MTTQTHNNARRCWSDQLTSDDIIRTVSNVVFHFRCGVRDRALCKWTQLTHFSTDRGIIHSDHNFQSQWNVHATATVSELVTGVLMARWPAPVCLLVLLTRRQTGHLVISIPVTRSLTVTVACTIHWLLGLWPPWVITRTVQSELDQ